MSAHKYRRAPEPLPELRSRRQSRDLVWAIVFAAIGMFLAITTPTGTSMAPFHLGVSFLCLIAVVIFAGRWLDRRDL
jgi:hypothetical protein